ncbi:MAG: rhomboid family intramembrane serine protease [Flavobacteriaceae bacterium]|nr:rhomboid family intramembrane serine protease [Flavobacteriaceae bacterium]
MSSWIDSIKNKYLTGSIVEKIIFINISIFIFTYLLNTLSFLLNIDGNFIINWFALSPHFNALITKPWTLISYGFLHHGFLHIVFNLIFLYYIGNIFLDFFNRKQFLTYYFFGIISGAIIYLLSYNYLPALKTQETVLVGASAGVTTILVGIATHIPQYAIRFRLIGSVKLLYIAIFLIALDVIQIPNGNAGGHLAHLGGALIGYLLTSYLQQGKGFIQWVESLFQAKKDRPLKTVYKNKKTTKSTVKNPKEQQIKIDHILDKISKSGYETLTKSEKDFLFKVGKK